MGGVPSTLGAILAVLLAVAPGYLYRRALRRHALQDERSATIEMVELFSVGAVATLVSALGVAGIAELAPALVSIEEVTNPVRILDHPWRIVLTTASVVLLSSGLCLLGGRTAARLSPSRVGSTYEGSTWSRQLATPSAGRPPYLAVELADGRLVEGYVRAVSSDDDAARRFLVLQTPLAITGPGDRPRRRTGSHFLLIPGGLINVVHGKYIDPETLRPRKVEAASGGGEEPVRGELGTIEAPED